jgi:tetratricopeptide (TPR) repeat protein
VLVLDTLEEPLLNHGEGLAALLHGLAIVRRACPDLRVVLSGRYDIREKLSDCAGLGHGFDDTDGAPKSFDDVTDNRALQRFADAEADGYLVQIRRVEVDDETRKAAVEKGDGIPFKLALLGDLLASGPGLSAETIRAYPSADLLYLIERVIDRLPNPQLRWVLRYGVVPERLDRDFLEVVMAPHLTRAMSGAEAGDDPRKGLEGIPTKSSVFRTDLLSSPDAAIDTGALWKELERYASASAWVSAGEAPGSLSFHPEVRVPMRDLLRGQAIFADLHGDAVAYFERRAAAEPQARIDRLCSSVYHRHQRDGDGAMAAFQALLDAEIGVDPEARRRLALTVLGPDFVGEDGRPRQLSDGTAIVSTATILAARWEHARAAAEIAWATMMKSGTAPGGALWTEAWKALDAAERLEREAGLDVAAPAAKALALHYCERARGSTGAPDLGGAAEILERALTAEMSARDRLRIERELAGLLFVVRPDRAQIHHDAALSLARSMDAEDKVAVDIRMGAADTLFRRGAYGAAIEHLRAALDGLRGKKIDAPEARATTAFVALQLAEAELRAGRPAEAFALVKGPLVDQTGWNPRRNALAARVSLALFEPEGAIIESAIADDRIASALNPDVARFLEARGEALMELHEITAANGAFEGARAIWDELG